MNWGSASNGFLDGFERGTAMRERRKQRELQAAAQEFEKEQQLRNAKLREEQFAADNARFERQFALQEKAFGEQAFDNAWGREFKLGQANRADALQEEKLKFLREEAEREARAKHGQQIMGQLQSAMTAYNEKPQQQAKLDLIQAQTEALRAKAAGIAGGEAGVGAAPGQAPMGALPMGGLDPAIIAKRQQLLNTEKKLAAGDNYWGPDFLGLGQHRKWKADEQRQALAALEAPLGANVTPQQQRMAAMPVGVQQQFTTRNAQPLAPQDQQALAWAKANPSDPRAAAILQQLGRQ